MSRAVVESLVGQVSKLKSGIPLLVKVGEVEALIFKTKDGVFATGSKCSHYGAPLINGVVSGNRVVCPWHGACFNVCTGDIEEAPAVQGIPSFPVRLDGDDVYVTAQQDGDQVSDPSFTSFKDSSRHIVVVGGGAAGNAAVETLRSNGFEGRVTLISGESFVPYDRPKLSKNLSVSADGIALRSREFYKAIGVDLRLESVVDELDASSKSIKLSNGETLLFDDVIVCTGSTPFNIPVPGHDAENVFLLRDPLNASKIEAAASKAKDIVVVGTGFIGLEAATYFKKNKQVENVTAVSMDDVPLSRVFGDRIGKVFQKMHEDNGVKLMMNAKLERYQVVDGKVVSVILGDGTAIPCDFVLVGAGVRLNTGFLRNVQLGDRDKSITVNEYMKHDSGIYAAGDIARFPYSLHNGRMYRIEHWNVAQKQGRIAALNILGKHEKYDSVPYFWTVQFGGSVRYVGHSEDHDDVIVIGNPEEDSKFAAFYVRDDTVLAVATLGKDPIASACAELMRLGKMPSGTSIREGIDVVKLLQSLN